MVIRTICPHNSLETVKCLNKQGSQVVYIVFNLFSCLIINIEGKVRTKMLLHVHVVGHKDHTVLS